MNDKLKQLMSDRTVIITFAIIVAGVFLVSILLKRPVKLSLLENAFIEVGIEQVIVDHRTYVDEGPPERYRAVIELSEGKTVYVLGDGSCMVRENQEEVP